jgi:glycosyltransferase 2 family protein
VGVYLGFSLYADFGKIIRAFLSFNWQYLPLIFLLVFSNYLFRYLKWSYYLSILDIKISQKESFAIFLSGLTMAITPGKMGEVLKSYLLKEINGTPISRSAPIVLAERFTDFISIALLSVFGVTTFKYGLKTLGISFGVMGFILVMISWPPLSSTLIKWLSKWPLVSKGAAKLEIAYESMSSLMLPRALIWTVLISCLAWFCECLAFYLVFYGFNLSHSLNSSVFIYAFSTLIGALSMLPGGLGATEGSITGLLLVLKIPKHMAVASTFIIRICTLWFGILIGIIAFSFTQRKLMVNYEPSPISGHSK